jgi:zona occludens toxin
MAINAYVGLQGSGKSYEVVSSPILDAIAHGRDVVTNVAGIDEERIHEYLIKKRDLDPEKLGKIIHVSNERINEPQFFPDEEKSELVSIVKGGDLVAIDEAWRFWGSDSGKLSHEHMQFFRMHRHYVHPDTAVACDVVLMTQDISGLHRSVKNVIEFVFSMHKHKALGFSNRYRVEIHDGWKVNRKTRIDDRQKKYETEIFHLYQSYTGGKGNETTIDSRQNILANKTLWLYALGIVALMSISFFSAWRFFHKSPAETTTPEALTSASSKVVTSVSSAVISTPKNTKLNASEVWRFVGEYETGGERWVIVSNASGRFRVESPSAFHGKGLSVVGDVDGDSVTRWSGSSFPGAQEKNASNFVQVGK